MLGKAKVSRSFEHTTKHVIIHSHHGRPIMLQLGMHSSVKSVLDGACQTLKLNPDQYELRYCDNKLSPSLHLLTMIPNNAELHVSSTSKKISGFVPVNLLVGDEEKLCSGMFRPSDSLWDVICELCPNDSFVREDRICLSFIGKDIVGKENLKLTTLSSLGVKSGPIVARLESKYSETKLDMKTKTKIKRSDVTLRGNRILNTDKSDSLLRQSTEFKIPEASKKTYAGKDYTFSESEGSEERMTKTKISPSVGHSKPGSNHRIIKFLDHHGVVYSAKSRASRNSLSMDCFELSMAEVRTLKEGVKTARKDYKGTLNCPERMNFDETYVDARIRIQFPDEVVLQGLFRPNETISDVMNFVKRYLQFPDTEFYLYTKKPKLILVGEETLFEAECYPDAKLYFGLDRGSVSKNQSYLRPELTVSMVSHSTASLVSRQKREKDFEAMFMKTKRPHKNSSKVRARAGQYFDTNMYFGIGKNKN